ncbi:MAG: LysR family transcriptional regulator [Chloroflexota bacterium]|nr:LysR family transcriptional regulator [Chloroflexota bacterium]
MINLWQLHVFLIVSETGSFSAAATRLHMTQPGVSQQVRGLETYLGSKLFVRRGHGVELTATGFDLLDPARRMMNLSEVTERTLMARRGEVSGRVRLGCSLPSGPFNVNPLVYEFRDKNPEVSLQIELVEPGPLLGALRAQELDGGIVMGRMRGRGLVHHKLVEDPIALIVPLGHQWTSPIEISRAEMEQMPGESSLEGLQMEGRPLLRHEEESWMPAIKPSMLNSQPMVLEHSMGESHSDARRALNDALEERGLTTRDLHVVLEVPDPTAVACAVAEGLGIGFVPQSIARRFVGQVATVRVDGFNMSHHVYLIHDRKALHSPAVAAWWKFIEGKLGARTREDAPAGEQAMEATGTGNAEVRTVRTPARTLQEA